MSRLSRILAAALALVALAACGARKAETAAETEAPAMKVVAYLPMWAMPYSPDWDKITHVNLSFGKVNADGSIDMSAIAEHAYVVEQAHAHGVKALVSIGGGGSEHFSDAILDKERRTRLTAELAAWTDRLGLDGIDVDYEEWEGGPGGVGESDIARREALEAFYSELREALGPDRLLTAAVNASWDNGGYGTYNCFSNTMHPYLDFVSLMIYDETGPWSGTRTGPHSGWDFFEHAIAHWLENRELPKEKLVAGVPFYGYRFSRPDYAGDAESIPYRRILELYPDSDAHLRDSIGLLYYDGMPTMERKVQYLKDNGLGGVMFWEITKDTDDADKSLLNLIDKMVKG